MSHVYLRTAETLCLISSSILCVYVRLRRRVEIVCGQIEWPMSSIRVMCGPDQWRGGCCTPFATARGREGGTLNSFSVVRSEVIVSETTSQT